jgi:hypothetical protein
MSKSVIGILDTRQQAEQAVNDLQAAGFGLPKMSVLSAGVDGSQDFVFVRRSKAIAGALAGVGIGGALIAALGLLAGMGMLVVPGLGPFIAAGPLLAALSGTAIGAVIGGIVGALAGMAIPEIEAKRYDRHAIRGQLLVAVHVDTREAARDAAKVLRRDGARDVMSTRDAHAPAMS